MIFYSRVLKKFSHFLNTPEIPPEIKFHQIKNFPTIWPLNTPDLWNSTRSGSSELNPINKKILGILTKFSDFWKFPQIFNMCSYQKILRKISRNLSSQLHQNILSENFSDFLKKWRVQISQIFVRKFLRTQIFVVRIKPWTVLARRSQSLFNIITLPAVDQIDKVQIGTIHNLDDDCSFSIILKFIFMMKTNPKLIIVTEVKKYIFYLQR